MTTETTVQNLKINKLTSAQYNTITPSSTELYMVTDDNSYQEKLVSGTNIKTINNNSLLGSGNITISSGGAARNIGEIVTSTIPLTDAGLHSLDGTLINGSGSYSAFVSYMADLYSSSTSLKTYNVDIIGSLTNNNGVLSGFSTTNYATVKAPAVTINSFELVFKVTTKTDVTNYQACVGQTTTNIHTPQINLPTDNAGHIRFSFPLGNNTWSIIDSSFSIAAYTTYYLKMVYDGSYNKAYYSTNGTTFTLVGQAANSNGIQWDEKMSLGNDQGLSPFSGSFDLNECYININGLRWWSGSSLPCFCTEDEWQASVSTYGACDKYVYDSVNNTVRLPKRTTEHGVLLKSYSSGADWYRIYEDGWCEQGGSYGTTSNSAANSNQTITLLKSYTDVNYSIQVSHQTNAQMEYDSNVHIYSKTASNFILTTQKGINYWQACGYVDVSDYQYSPIYEYIVIATTTKTDIEVDIDEIATDLNGKADVDLTNVNNNGYIKMAGAGKPSNTYVNLTLGASGATYTAPADGYYYLRKGCNATYQYYSMVNSTADFLIDALFPVNWGVKSTILPVKKGDTVKITYNAGGTTEVFRFIYAKGSESEAS